MNIRAAYSTLLGGSLQFFSIHLTFLYVENQPFGETIEIYDTSKKTLLRTKVPQNGKT